MKRYFIGYMKPNGFCAYLTTDAIDESDARRQFYEIYERHGLRDFVRGTVLRKENLND